MTRLQAWIQQRLTLKGSSLMMAMTVTLLMSILITSIIVIHGHYSAQIIQFIDRERDLENVQSAFNLLMDDQVQGDLVFSNQIFQHSNDRFHFKRIHWGAYRLMNASLYRQSDTLSHGAITGYSSDYNPPVLYLSDTGQPLTLNGSTFISGKAYLPKSSVKRGYIEGSTFKGEKLINGYVLESNGSLPDIEPGILSAYDDLVSLKNQDWIDIQPWTFEIDQMHRTFERNTILYNSNWPVELNNIDLSGNIIIRSETEVIIGASAQLDNVIIVAPSIIVMPDFEGAVHLMASENLYINERCSLMYPSTLAVITEVNQTNDEIPLLHVTEGCTIQGALLFLNRSFSAQGGIHIATDTNIEGSVYSNNYTELRGRVNGTMHTRSFRLKTESALYTNHLLNATIDRDLSKHFVWDNLISGNNTNTIIKWLN